jgi:hypothetical protein
MVEPRHARRRGHRNPELLPQSLTTTLQLFDRRADDVFHNDETRVRRHDDAFGGDQPVRRVACIFVQQGDGGDQLANQAEGGVGIELNAALMCKAQDLGEPRPFDMVGDHGERSVALSAVDAADARVVRVAEVQQARGALAQRELERRNRRQRRPQPQDLQQLTGRGVSGNQSFAEAVGKERCFRTINRR